MPTLPLTTYLYPTPLRATEPGGAPLTVPLPQFRCLVELPDTLFPRDGIIDTGSPLSWMPEAVPFGWRGFWCPCACTTCRRRWS